MFSPNKKRPQLPVSSDKSSKPVSPAVKKRLWTVLALTFLLLFIYYGCIGLGFVKAIMLIYFVAFAAILITYLAYNRCFLNKDVTVDMLPAEWSEEKKHSFVEGNRLRAERSRWMLTLIIPFVIVFMCEALYLFVWEGYLADLFLGER